MLRPLLFFLLLATGLANAQSPQPPAASYYVVMFTVDGCAFCKMLRERVMQPMIASGELPAERFYEINMTDKSEWFFFDPMNDYLQKRDLYRKYDLGLFPTTVILDDRAELLAPRLVGITTPEKFQRQLQDALRRLTSRP